MSRPACLYAIAATLLCLAAISTLTTAPALASGEAVEAIEPVESSEAVEAVKDAEPAARPAGWHSPDRVFAGAPVARTTEEIREMRARRRSASDPARSCYYTEHMVSRCPQAGRPWLF